MFRQEYEYVLERMPQAREDDVKFRLIYDGELPPEDKAGADLKHRIRQQFHPQLRALWTEEPVLKPLGMGDLNGRTQIDAIADEYSQHGFRFVPLVRRANSHGCRLDILMLLRNEPKIMSGFGAGDLDNRVKTLMDGLRMPTHQRSEFGTAADTGPSAEENPFFCLFDDDQVVYEIAIATDRLLAPIRPDQKFRDAVAIINVHVTSALKREFAYLAEGFELITRRF